MSLLNTFDDEYARLEFNTNYKDLPEEIKQQLYNYVVNKHPLDDFLRGICTNDLRLTLRGKEEYDAYIRQIFLWFYNVCPGNMYGLENYINSDSQK